MRLYTAAASLLCLILVPFVASALGLGEISLNSALNEPFSAEIPLDAVQQSDLDELTVELASADTFERYGLDRPAFLNDFSFTIAENKNGQPVLSLSSSMPVAEPFVTMLLDVRWSSGRLLREYTVLLDPPLFEANVVQSAAAPAQSSPTLASPAEGEVKRPAAPAPAEVIAPTGLFQTPSEPAPVAESATPDEPSYDVSVDSPSESVVAPEPEPVVAAEPAPAEESQPAPAAPAYAADPLGNTPFQDVATSPSASAPDYTTKRGDTLWGISERVRDGSGLSNNQMMLALYRANPEAFMGNINRLKAGVILRIPAGAELEAPPAAEATAEVIEQNAAWSASRGQESRLQLVAPAGTDDAARAAETETAVDSGAAAEAEDTASTEAGLDDQAAERERLLQIEDAEMQALQERVDEQEQADIAQADAQEQIFADTDAVAPPGADAIPEETADVAADVPQDTAAPAPGRVGAAPAEETSFLGGIFSSLWFWGSLAIVLLAAILLARARKTETEPVADAAATGSWVTDIDEPAYDETAKDFGELGSSADAIVIEEEEGTPTFSDDPDATVADLDFETAGQDEIEAPGAQLDSGEGQAAGPFADSFAAPDAESEQDVLGDDLDFRVDADDIFAAPDVQDDIAVPQEAAGQDEIELPLEKTISTGAPLNLDQADPIAEAEFHMAYGLYDQAADLLTRALEDAPDKRIYRVKLIEVFFVWENKEGFLEQARALRNSITDDSDSDWNKVLILGKQLCPDDELFTGAAAALASAGAMDLELSDVGETEIDFTLGGGEVQVLDLDIGSDADSGSEDGGLDIDFGGDAGEGDELTLNLSEGSDDFQGSPEADTALDSSLVDLDFGDSDSEPTLETPTLETPTMESPTIENPTVGADGVLSDDDATVESDFLAESPTMESPTIENPAVSSDRQLSDTDATMESDTLESSMDGATLESPTLDAFGTGGETTEMPGLDDPSSLDIDLSGLTDLPVDSGDLSDTEDGVFGAEVEGATGDTDLGSAEDDVGGDTIEQPPVDAVSGDTAEQPALDEFADTGVADDAQDAMADDAEPWSLPEDATMTEVGTKLDLARAYIDMGDPDGARSILNEVLDEGEVSQQQEARQLLAELDD